MKLLDFVFIVHCNRPSLSILESRRHYYRRDIISTWLISNISRLRWTRTQA